MRVKTTVWYRSRSNVLFFFFQAEDGIRDYKVTGVQTCALPISSWPPWRKRRPSDLVDSRRIRRVPRPARLSLRYEIGRASCRERVKISVVAVSLKKKDSYVVQLLTRTIDTYTMSRLNISDHYRH